MMNYGINPSNRYIKKQEFIWRDLGLDSTDGDIYALILNLGHYTGTYSDLMKITGIKSLTSIQKRVNRMVNNEIIKRRQIPISGTMTRTVLAAVYNEMGMREDWEIEQDLDIGQEEILNYYNERKYINLMRQQEGRKSI